MVVVSHFEVYYTQVSCQVW